MTSSKKSEVGISLTEPKCGEPFWFALDPESQGCCDSGVVFAFFVAVSPPIKGKNWSH